MRSSGSGLDDRTSRAVERVRAELRGLVASYRQAEGILRVGAAGTVVACLRRDHERHLAELDRVCGRGEPDRAGAVARAVARALDGGQISADAVLTAVRNAELRLREVQARAIRASAAESVRAVLSRHRAVGRAHLEWLDQSERIGLRGAA